MNIIRAEGYLSWYFPQSGEMMGQTEPRSLEEILRLCVSKAPDPWYPSVYSQLTGIPRDNLDPFLERLRLGGLIRLTDWVQGYGQGYTPTLEGMEVAKNPRLMKRLQGGQVPQIIREQPLIQEEVVARTWERGEAARAAFLQPNPRVVTFSLIILNIAFFLAGLVVASHEQVSPGDYLNATPSPAYHKVLDSIGALSGSDLYYRHQWWRLLTCCFVHIGWMHLAMNMVALYMFGPLMEGMWGTVRFIALYFLAGFGGSCGMVIENPVAGGAGASGAIWGVLTSMVIWFLIHRNAFPRQFLNNRLGQLGFILLLNISFTQYYPNISKGGHYGGGLVGLLAAFPLDYLRYGPLGKRWLGLVGLIAILLASVGVMVRALEGKAGLKIRQWQTQVEFASFRGDLFQVQESVTKAGNIYEAQIFPTLINLQKAPEAKPEKAPDVKNAMASLLAARTNLEDVQKILAAAGPFYSPVVEQARLKSQGYIGAWIKLLNTASKGLGPDVDWQKEEKDLPQDFQRVEDATNDWNDFLKKHFLQQDEIAWSKPRILLCEYDSAGLL